MEVWTGQKRRCKKQEDHFRIKLSAEYEQQGAGAGEISRNVQRCFRYAEQVRARDQSDGLSGDAVSGDLQVVPYEEPV